MRTRSRSAARQSRARTRLQGIRNPDVHPAPSQVVRIENGRVTGRYAGPCLWALRRAGEGIRTLDVHLGKPLLTRFRLLRTVTSTQNCSPGRYPSVPAVTTRWAEWWAEKRHRWAETCRVHAVAKLRAKEHMGRRHVSPSPFRVSVRFDGPRDDRTLPRTSPAPAIEPGRCAVHSSKSRPAYASGRN